MSWASLFSLVNAVALIAWGVLILTPRRAWLIDALRLCVAGGLATLYVGLIVTALTVGFAGPTGPAPDFSTISGVRAIFASDGGAVTGWIHYLAFDLVAGLWIAGDADARRINRFVQAPVLVVCFLAGPAGLFLHLLLTRLVWRTKGE
jgi:hypothetical protein